MIHFMMRINIVKYSKITKMLIFVTFQAKNLKYIFARKNCACMYDKKTSKTFFFFKTVKIKINIQFT